MHDFRSGGNDINGDCVRSQMSVDDLPLQLQLSGAPFRQHPPMALEAE